MAGMREFRHVVGRSSTAPAEPDREKAMRPVRFAISPHRSEQQERCVAEHRKPHQLNSKKEREETVAVRPLPPRGLSHDPSRLRTTSALVGLCFP
jgi:hypothetical protein